MDTKRKPNTNQQEAIAMILSPSPTPPILVIGPFGTGKTFTLNLVCVSILSQSEHNKVLICTHSNSAADLHLQHLDTMIRNKPSLRLRPLRVLSIFRNIQTVNLEKFRKYCLIEGIFPSSTCLYAYGPHRREFFPLTFFVLDSCYVYLPISNVFLYFDLI